MVLYMGIVVYAPALALEALTGLSQELSVLLIGIVCMLYSILGGMMLQYLNLRFGARARTCASLLFSLQMVLYMGIVVYAPALALEALTGLSQELSVLLIGIVCMLYSILGGMMLQYLNLRFGARARTCASLLFSLQMVLYMGIVVYAPALALEALTGLSQELSVLLVGIVCMFYSTLGGMKAVIWTDLFQSLLMFAAVLSVIFAAVLDKGSLQAIWQIAVDGGRINFNNTDLDPTVRHSYLSLLIGGGFTFMSLYAVNQTQVQRYLTMKDLKTAVRSLWLSIIILLLLSGLTCFSGLAIYSKYYGCDPVLSGRIARKDQLLPLFVVETMGDIPGLSGLFVAGIFSASLSTVSACLNSLAAVTLEDYVKPLYRLWTDSEIPTSRCAFISKLLALTYGVVCLAMAFLSQLLGGVLQAALSIFGMVGGPIFGVFSLGLFFPFANEPESVSLKRKQHGICLWQVVYLTHNLFNQILYLCSLKFYLLFILFCFVERIVTDIVFYC
ncbi:putative sodium-dependent multivitamin transporter isoform X1 [Homalodisca vitripennis]|uniref:putative sodium-dependent multivitamin transporter isoform X1 n=1 Tax=Homalodisca vitripennis TaxID=197043 RepID=UPI001EEC5B31|nr:putative sodium-dependent multivitamin transporter isoform X1 [Homalodisca vitripennis]